MNKKILIGVTIAVIGLAAFIAYRVLTSRTLSPAQTTNYNYKGLDLKVVYCRPFKKGRKIFGDVKDSVLIPNGKYWRLGANEATEITFSKDVNFAGKALKSGSYRMYAIPNAQSWTIALNSELGKWGYDEPDHDQDVLSVDVPVQAGSPTEQFTIRFGNDSSAVNIELAWDLVRLSVPIAVQ